MTLQQIIERLLRSRLYRTRVVLQLDNGEVREGLVRELVYDGSRSQVVVSDPSAPRQSPGQRLPLARIASVEPARDPDVA